MDRKSADLLLHIYGSVLDIGRLPELVDRMTDALEARGGVLVVQERGTPFSGFDAMSRFYRETHREKVAFYQAELAHHEADDWMRLSAQRVGAPMLDVDLGLTVEQFDSRPHTAWAVRELGIRRRMALRLNDSPGWSDALAFAYPAEMAAVPDAATRRAKDLAPHLARALETTRAFNLLRQRYAAVLSAIDRFGLGLAIALSSGEVLVRNAEALRLCEEGDAIRMRPDGRLDCALPAETSQLLKAIARTARTASGEDELTEAPLRLTRRSGREPVLAHVVPLRDGAGEIESGLSGAVIYLMDLANPPAFDVPRFASLFGLSPAETEVCRLIVDGADAKEIAERRSTSVHTARDQAKAVLSKTGCASRGQLFRLIARTLPPLA